MEEVSIFVASFAMIFTFSTISLMACQQIGGMLCVRDPEGNQGFPGLVDAALIALLGLSGGLAAWML